MKKEENLQAILDDVPEGKEFRLENGSLIRNVPELYQALQRMDPSVFRHHVTSDRNDFSDWIRGVQQDRALAESLRPSMRQEECLAAVAGRIYEIQKAAELYDKDDRSRISGLLEVCDAKTSFSKSKALVQKDESHESSTKSPQKPAISLPDLRTKCSYPDFGPLISYPIFPVEKDADGPDDKTFSFRIYESDDAHADAPMKLYLKEDEDGNLILPSGGDSLIKDAEDAHPKRIIQKEVRDFASDMRKIFRISLRKKKKDRIEDLKRVFTNGQEE